MGDSVPDDEDIKWDLKWPQYNRSEETSGMQEENLRRCLVETGKAETETLNTSNWRKLVELIQMALRDGQLM